MKRMTRRDAVVGFLTGILGFLLPKRATATESKPTASCAMAQRQHTPLEYQTYVGGTSESTPFPGGQAGEQIGPTIIYSYDAAGRLTKTVIHYDDSTPQ